MISPRLALNYICDVHKHTFAACARTVAMGQSEHPACDSISCGEVWGQPSSTVTSKKNATADENKSSFAQDGPVFSVSRVTLLWPVCRCTCGSCCASCCRASTSTCSGSGRTASSCSSATAGSCCASSESSLTPRHCACGRPAGPTTRSGQSPQHARRQVCETKVKHVRLRGEFCPTAAPNVWM